MLIVSQHRISKLVMKRQSNISLQLTAKGFGSRASTTVAIGLDGPVSARQLNSALDRGYGESQWTGKDVV